MCVCVCTVHFKSHQPLLSSCVLTPLLFCFMYSLQCKQHHTRTKRFSVYVLKKPCTRVWMTLRFFFSDTPSFSVFSVSLWQSACGGNVSFTLTALEIDQKANRLGWRLFLGQAVFPAVGCVVLYTPSHLLDRKLYHFFSVIFSAWGDGADTARSAFLMSLLQLRCYSPSPPQPVTVHQTDLLMLLFLSQIK